jgi:hypothetical protein
MRNVLDTAPIHAFVCRLARQAPEGEASARLEKLYYAKAYRDDRCFREARPEELTAAPDFIQAAIQRGEAIQVFQACPSLRRRLNTVTQRVADAAKLSTSIPANASEAAAIAKAREFMNKLSRADFETIARKSLEHARIYQSWLAQRDHVCPPGEVRATRGRVWRRVTSLAELQRTGREFTNCLARTSRAGAYGAGLVNGQLQFWVLRERSGAGLFIASAAANAPLDFREVKGPRNVPVDRGHPDLECLAHAILAPGQEPPTPPSPFAPAAIARLFPSHQQIEDIVCAPIGLDPMPISMHVVRMPTRRRKAS